MAQACLSGAALAVLAAALPCDAQPVDHAAHHPGTVAVQSAAPAVAPTKKTVPSVATGVLQAPKGMAGMMAGMMAASPGVSLAEKPAGCCGGAGQLPFYPSLMTMPAVTPEARRQIRVAAIARLGAGSETLTAGQADLHRARSTNDLVGAQAAISEVREGLSLASSGTSALQALNEAQPPKRIALTWFQRETAVINANGEQRMDGFRDLSWFHVFAMMLLAAALVAAFLMRRARLQRIEALAERLTPGGAAPAAAKTPAPAGTAAKPPGDTAKPAAGAAAPPAVAASKPAGPPKPWKGALRIKSIFDETPTVKTFRLMEAAGGPIPFTFLPGQYASIVSEIDGQKVRRSYTISSSPTQRDYIELTIKREQYGLESRHMHDHAQTGDLLEMSAPAGKFFFTGVEAKGIVLIAGGVGVTPMMSVLRDLTDRSYEHEIHFIHAVRTPADLIFREEVEYLARRHPKVHVAAIVAEADGTDWKGAVGRISPEFIVECVPDIAERRVHLCGPLPMMDAVKYALTQLKVPPEQVKTEDFAPPKGGPVTDKDADDAPPAEAKPAAEAAPAAPAQAPAGDGTAAGDGAPSAQATVKFSKSDKTGQLASDQPVLEAAEAIGVVIDFECRVGTCGRCKVQLTEGEVTMEVEDALSAEEKAAGTILACQAKSVGNLVVDA